MENKTAILVLNGKEFDANSFKKIYNDQFIIAVDGGINHIYKYFPDITVDLHIGDMDSCEQSALDNLSIAKTMKFPVEKDYSDYDLALEETHVLGYNNAIVFGAFGGRKDHFMSNFETSVYFAGKSLSRQTKNLFSILHKNKSSIHEEISEEIEETIPCCFSPVILIGEKENMYFLNSSTKFKFSPKTSISIFAGSDKVKHLTIKGFKYRLIDTELSRDNPLGLSNCAVDDTQSIEFTKGVIVVIENKTVVSDH
ncbi:MAG: thiamine diphosphokinase [Candidatus Delongbacteria bacterium]|nr:thiamine diphosphokinase [Candidatus Delongbacteria bacterium]